MGGFPIAIFDQVVELDEVDLIDTQPLQAPFEFGPSCTAGAFAGLGRQENLAAMVLQPWRQPQLRLAVARSRIEVVHARGAHEFDRGIGAALAHRAKRSRSEDDTRAVVTGAPERR